MGIAVVDNLALGEEGEGVKQLEDGVSRLVDDHHYDAALIVAQTAGDNNNNCCYNPLNFPS